MQNPEGHHAGDLPNLTVGANGKGAFKSTIQNVTLAGDGATSLFHAGGTSVVIHEKADDMKTDPAGNAGARICLRSDSVAPGGLGLLYPCAFFESGASASAVVRKYLVAGYAASASSRYS